MPFPKCTLCAETLSQVTTYFFIGHHLFPTRSPPSLTWPKSICHCACSHAYRWPPPHSLNTDMMFMHRPFEKMHFSIWVKLRKCTLCAETLSQITTFSFIGQDLFPTRSPPSLTWPKSICDCPFSHAYRWPPPHSLHTDIMLMHRPSERMHFSLWVKLRKYSLCAESLSHVIWFQ